MKIDKLRSLIREVIQEDGRDIYNPIADDWNEMRNGFLGEIEDFAVEADKFKKLLDKETRRLNDEKRHGPSPFFESRDIVKYHAELNKFQKLMEKFIKITDAAWDTNDL